MATTHMNAQTSPDESRFAREENEPETLVGVFSEVTRAQSAVADLRRAGFPDDQIGFIARDRGFQTSNAGDIDFDPAKANRDTGDSAAEGAIGGAVAGGSIATLWGLAVAAGLIPAIGPLIAGGAVAALLASVATGATVGGVFGFFVGMGIPEDEARLYERELHSGRTLVSVQPGDRRDEAAAILQRHGGFTDSNLATPY